MVDKLGRRTLFIISNVGMLIGMVETVVSPSPFDSTRMQISECGRSPPLFSTRTEMQRLRKVCHPARPSPYICSRHPHSLATIPFIFLFYFFYDIAYTPMLVAYTLEILPFNIRAKGFAVMVRFSSSAQRVQVFSSQ